MSYNTPKHIEDNCYVDAIKPIHQVYHHGIETLIACQIEFHYHQVSQKEYWNADKTNQELNYKYEMQALTK